MKGLEPCQKWPSRTICEKMVGSGTKLETPLRAQRICISQFIPNGSCHISLTQPSQWFTAVSQKWLRKKAFSNCLHLSISTLPPLTPPSPPISSTLCLSSQFSSIYPPVPPTPSMKIGSKEIICEMNSWWGTHCQQDLHVNPLRG